MRKTASGWEDARARRSKAVPTIFDHRVTDVRVVVRGDGFTFAESEADSRKIQSKMCEWFDVKVRGAVDRARREQHC